MVDRISEEHRSWNMSRIKSKNTKPEMIVRSLLHKMGYRFRLHAKDLPGKPDIVLKKYKTVIFVNGCFWHQHEGCKLAKIPDSKHEFWLTKLQSNAERDKKNYDELRNSNWYVIIIWGCEIQESDQIIITLEGIKNGKNQTSSEKL